MRSRTGGARGPLPLLFFDDGETRRGKEKGRGGIPFQERAKEDGKEEEEEGSQSEWCIHISSSSLVVTQLFSTNF